MRALLAVLLFAAAVGAFAQSPMDKAITNTETETPKVPAALTDENPALPESAPSVVMDDPATRAQYLAAMQKFYEYRANGYAYRSRVFEWQLLSSRVIFVIVIMLVLAGIYFAAVQFHVAMIAARRNLLIAPTADAVAGPKPLATQHEISAKGVVINSSVLGVIILGLSLAFFYLYLVYVYPIQNVF